MMHVMDRLTDRPNWSRDVFDEEVVARWRTESLAIPDREFWRMAASDRLAGIFPDDGGQEWNPPIRGILNETAFDYVSSGEDLFECRYADFLWSVSRSFGTRQNITRYQASCRLLTAPRLL